MAMVWLPAYGLLMVRSPRSVLKFFKALVGIVCRMSRLLDSRSWYAASSFWKILKVTPAFLALRGPL
ncbi:hypothetical protein D9M72_513290 [compost metagenome]